MSRELESEGRILIYQTEKGDTKIDVYFENDTIWMPQRGIAELYQTSPQNITMHIRNIYSDGELDEEATCKNNLQVQNEGGREVNRSVKCYNFDMILAMPHVCGDGRGLHPIRTNPFKSKGDDANGTQC